MQHHRGQTLADKSSSCVAQVLRPLHRRRSTFRLEGVPHLREVVCVEGINRSGLVPNEAGMAVPSPRLRIFAGLDTSADPRLTIRLALVCTTECLSVARGHHVMLTGNFGRFGGSSTFRGRLPSNPRPQFPHYLPELPRCGVCIRNKIGRRKGFCLFT
jgi:hypothetical protein